MKVLVVLIVALISLSHKPAPPAPQPVTPPAPPAMAAPAKGAVIIGEVTAVTPVPDPKLVLPYVNVLIMQEVRVKSISAGALEGVSPSTVIRVFRWGIRGGEVVKLVAETKQGDTLTLPLERFSDHPEFEREYQVDKLPEDFTAPVLLETSGY